MSFSQWISYCFAGAMGPEWVREPKPHLTPTQRVDVAMKNLDESIDDSQRIQRDTMESAKMLKKSSETVIDCLTCPHRIKSEQAACAERRDMP